MYEAHAISTHNDGAYELESNRFWFQEIHLAVYMQREEAEDAARKGEQLKTIFLQMFDEHYESALLTFRHLILHHMVKYLRRFLLLSVLYCSPLYYFYEEIEHAYGEPAQGRRTRGMKTVNLMDESYDMTYQYAKEDIGGSLRSENEIIVMAKRTSIYFVPNGIIITMGEIPEATYGSVQGNFLAKVFSGFAECFRENTIKLLIELFLT